MSLFSLANSAALVTGSSAGIGHAIGTALVSAGAEVVFHGTRPRGRDIPPESPYLTVDLRTATAHYELIRGAAIRLPSLNLLVCNAGGFYDVPFLDMTIQRWKHTIHLNLSANYFLIQEFAKRMIQEKREASVVIVAASNAFQAEPASTAYDVSQGGLLMMTKSLAMALAEHRIRVNAIAPGPIATSMTAERMRLRPELDDLYEKKSLLDKLGKPEDCAGAVVFLCSSAARHITGEIIRIDGGLTAAQIGRL